MKKHFFLSVAVISTMFAVFTGCRKELQEEKPTLGTITFKTAQTWKIGDQEWSDVVMATGCEEGNFRGEDNSTRNFCADCRQNPDYGDLFSWQAVNQYDSILCPDDWRVPTKEDFVNLDIALGGTGNTVRDSTLRNNYLIVWGGTCGGYCNADGFLRNQGSGAGYWSQSEYSSGNAYYLYFGSGGLVYPQDYYYKGGGFSLRCVR